MSEELPRRLCSRCKTYHDISLFEGSKKTCKVMLSRISEQRQRISNGETIFRELKPHGEEIITLVEPDAVKMHVHCIGCKFKDQSVYHVYPGVKGVRLKWDDPCSYAMNKRSSGIAFKYLNVYN